MTTPETPEDSEALIEKKGDIIHTKRLFDIHKIDPGLKKREIVDTEGIIVRNFNYLTENGRLSIKEYYELFQKCESMEEFSELALLAHEFIIKKMRQYLADNPDLHKEGSATEPGKHNIENIIAWNETSMKVISEDIDEGEKVPIIEIGDPPLFQTPDWILTIEENNMTMSEVYALLEKNDDGNNEALPGARDGVKEVRGKIDSL